MKLSQGDLTMEGKRTCVLFDPKEGDFSNVWTGDRVQIEVQLTPDHSSLEALTPLLQKIFLTKRHSLSDLVPAYWADCIHRKLDRHDKPGCWSLTP